MGKVYRGWRCADESNIVVVEIPGETMYYLPPRTDLRNHSPDGFEWGYGGSGPAQLALALCCDALDDDEAAQRVYQRVKELLVARIRTHVWERTEGEVMQAIGEALVRMGGEP